MAANGSSTDTPAEAGAAVISGGVAEATSVAQGGMAWKRYFFDSLWPARGKWGTGTSAAEGEPQPTALDFKITVCVRFRPLAEAPVDSKLGLPLHQYIKLQRQQAKQQALAAGGGGSGGDAPCKITVGAAPPARFLDGVFGTLMKDPVQLPSSGVVMDRQGALQAIKHRKKDPMDNTKLLHASRLVELPALKAEIDAWRRARALSDHELDRVKRSVIVRDLVDGDGAGLPPEVLEALLEAERLEALVQGAEDAAALDSKRRRGRGDRGADVLEPRDGDEHAHSEDDEVEGGAGWASGAGHSAAALTVGLEGAEKEASALGEAADGGQPSSAGHLQRRDGPRLLGLHPARVVMYVPGMGVRPFSFSRVLGGDVGQAACYDACAQPAVCAVLNGWNACVLAYGQTGR